MACALPIRKPPKSCRWCLPGKINKSLVNLLEMKGGKAMGISGMDGHLIEAKTQRRTIWALWGSITKVNVEPIY